jgi:hypothetical protein
MRGDVVHRSTHLLLGLRHVHRHHLLLGLVRLLGGLAVEQVRRQRDVALRGEAVANAADVIVDPPPLLEHDDAGAFALGLGEVALRRCAVRLELDLGHSFLLR